MRRIIFYVILLIIFSISACNDTGAQADSENVKTDYQGDKVFKTSQEWKEILSDEEYHILREEGTEKAFTSELLNNHKKGIYKCAACGFEIFSSETKFKSGTGWPSFYKPISSEHIAYVLDKSYGMERTEVQCPRCGGHLGHVFTDGPEPTGLRYCINGVSLDFEEQP